MKIQTVTFGISWSSPDLRTYNAEQAHPPVHELETREQVWERMQTAATALRTCITCKIVYVDGTHEPSRMFSAK